MRQRHLITSGDLTSRRRAVLERLPQTSQATFGASAAQRVLRSVDTGSEDAGRWRGLLEATWEAIGGDDAQARDVRAELERLEARADGSDPEAEDGLDLDHVAAVVYAAEALTEDGIGAASAAGMRALEAPFAVTEFGRGNGTLDRFIAAMAHPSVQSEMSRQLADLSLLREQGLNQVVLASLRG